MGSSPVRARFVPAEADEREAWVMAASRTASVALGISFGVQRRKSSPSRPTWLSRTQYGNCPGRHTETALILTSQAPGPAWCPELDSGPGFHVRAARQAPRRAARTPYRPRKGQGVQNWIEIVAEDRRRNRVTLRLARTPRGIKLLAPPADITHVVGDQVEALSELLAALASESDDTISPNQRQ